MVDIGRAASNIFELEGSRSVGRGKKCRKGPTDFGRSHGTLASGAPFLTRAFDGSSFGIEAVNHSIIRPCLSIKQLVDRIQHTRPSALGL